MANKRSARNDTVADKLARVLTGTRVRVFFMRDGVAQALSGTLIMVTGSEGHFRSVTGEATTIPIKAITSFMIPAEASAKAERERRRSVLGWWLIRITVGLVVLSVVGYFGLRKSDSSGWVLVVSIVLLASILPGLLVGLLVAKGERPDQLSPSDAIRANLIDNPAQFGTEEAELLSQIRRTHIKWMAVKFAFGTGVLFVATSQISSYDWTSIQAVSGFFLFVAAGSYIGTIAARGWMQVGNYRG
jgi:hypothetical protein